MQIYLRRQYRNGKSFVDATQVWDKELFMATRARECADQRELEKKKQTPMDVIAVYTISRAEYQKEKGYKVVDGETACA